MTVDKDLFHERFCWLLNKERAYGRSQDEIASALNVSKQTISGWKSGARTLRAPMVKTISAMFGVRPDWLSGEWSENVDPHRPADRIPR